MLGVEVREAWFLRRESGLPEVGKSRLHARMRFRGKRMMVLKDEICAYVLLRKTHDGFEKRVMHESAFQENA